MSTGEEEDVFIDEDLVARKDPDREAWEITDAEGPRTQVRPRVLALDFRSSRS
jgi:hypothetical protein